MLIKDEETSNIVLGDTLGDGKTRDGFEGSQFHYMLANPPFGVEWKDQKTVVEKEHAELGFAGRFGAGLPAINDGSLLFLQHMISKMHPYKDGDEDAVGSKIAIVFNGSPLFSGDAGSGPSNIRRWIIENDWLDAIVAMPDQLFYNTGIFTYVWLVTNRKAPERRGKVQLIDGTRFFARMKKSLNNKRNEISEEQIRHLTRVYGSFKDGETAEVRIDGESRDPRRLAHLREQGVRLPQGDGRAAAADELRGDARSASPGWTSRPPSPISATSKKRKDDRPRRRARSMRAASCRRPSARHSLRFVATGRYMDREALDADLGRAAKRAGIKVAAPVRKAIFSALGERDPDAEICRDGKGRPEPDSELRDTENIPLPEGTELPLPMEFGPDKPSGRLVEAFREVIDAYMAREVLPHVPDAWVDYDKTKVGYEIPINRHFYVYKPPRPLDEIEADIATLEGEIAGLLKGLAA